MRFIKFLQKLQDGHIDFREFMIVLYIMSNGSPEENLKQIFRVFDINNDGTISLKVRYCKWNLKNAILEDQKTAVICLKGMGLIWVRPHF